METRNYEATLALNIVGTKETADEMIQQIERDFREQGADIKEIHRLEKRKLAYNPQKSKLKEAYFAIFFFEADPGLIAKLRAQLKFNEHIVLSYFQRLALKHAT